MTKPNDAQAAPVHPPVVMPRVTERVVTCAAMMYEARSALRRMFATDYDEKIDPLRDLLRRVSSAERPTITVLIELLGELDKCGANGVEQMWWLAAAVDVIEAA
jgi:hypothetical protein